MAKDAEANPRRRSESTTLRPSDLARDAGISVDTIYHYERKGLWPRAERSAAGYREFPPEALRRLRVVRTALALGFGLDEIAEVMRDRDAGRPPCRRVLSLAVGKLEAVEREIAERIHYRNELATIVSR